MYSEQDFKGELLINLETEPEFSKDLINALKNSEFEFKDSHNFSRRGWNTYTRVLKIFCHSEDKLTIDGAKNELMKYVDRLHGRRDDFYIMDLIIFIRQSLEETKITESEIIITNKVTIDKKADYIGSGGFALIYKKDDAQTGMEYAYKILDPSPFQGSEPKIMKKRFLREAKKLLSYSHENIVHAYDFGFLPDDSAFIKMEYIDGDNLFEYIAKSFLSENDKELLVTQYISAMAYLHEKSDMHRDISYSNIMVTNDNKIKVLDFGFSKNNEDTVYDTVYASIVQKFAPPDSEYTIQTEIYCIGAVMYTIFAGKTFHNSITNQIDELLCEKKYKTALSKCLEINPEHRFQNAMELKNNLNESKISESTNNKSANKFSLDRFKEAVENIISIEFNFESFPTQLLIKGRCHPTTSISF